MTNFRCSLTLDMVGAVRLFDVTDVGNKNLKMPKFEVVYKSSRTWQRSCRPFNLASISTSFGNWTEDRTFSAQTNWGQSYKTFKALGWCKIKCLNCSLRLWEKRNSMNTLGCSILTVWPNIFLIKASCHALGWVCKFVQRCKKFFRIGPRLVKFEW